MVLLDEYGVDERDVAMADNLLEAISADTDGVAIALTGNLHNRTTRGTDFDPDYEPMGYLVEQALGSRRVRSLDVHYTGGQAWVCNGDGDCGTRRFDAPPDADSQRADVLPSIEVDDDHPTDAYDGRYHVENSHRPRQPSATDHRPTPPATRSRAGSDGHR